MSFPCRLPGTLLGFFSYHFPRAVCLHERGHCWWFLQFSRTLCRHKLSACGLHRQTNYCVWWHWRDRSWICCISKDSGRFPVEIVMKFLSSLRTDLLILPIDFDLWGNPWWSWSCYRQRRKPWTFPPFSHLVECQTPLVGPLMQGR